MILGSCSLFTYPLRISKPIQAIRASSTPLSWTLRNHNVDHRASSKLFADAEHEEQADAAPTRSAVLQGTTPEQPNWTGDERIEDAVLRMLVDKYKSLRTGTIKTAEEKIHRAPPQVTAQRPEISMSGDPSAIPSSRPNVYRADEALLPSVEGHKPWLTTFKVPSHATASIRYGHFPSVGSESSSTGSTRRASQAGPADDDRTRRNERESKKRSEIVGRLTRAKESTLDYRLGITKNVKSGVQARPNPVSMKGWAGLVEERIEVRCALSIVMNSRPFPSIPSERDEKDTSAPSRAAGSPSRGVLRNTTHSLLVKSFS